MHQIELLLAGFTNSSGDPLALGKVYTYEAGTTTPKSTYQDADGSVAHANPIILDSQGRKLAYGGGLYKFVIKDSSDNTLYTFDDIALGSAYPPGMYSLGTTSYSSNAYSATINPAILSYATGMLVVFTAGGSNSGAATLNLNGLGAADITRSDGNPVQSGDIVSGEVYIAVYNGSDFVLVGTDPISLTTQVAGILPVANGGTGANNATIVFGTYTPSKTLTANLDSFDIYTTMYFRLGTLCLVAGKFDADVTTGGNQTEAKLSLPISSNLAVAHDLCGVAVSGTSGSVSSAASIEADTTNDLAHIKFKTATTSAVGYFFIFVYRII